MILYSMTATFGKLEHETLHLHEGLNLVSAPNEWGKSTWCAFLVNMLYGLDTRARSAKGVLADKEHYAPWSGAPMSGRIELSWQGRDITIERRSTGRIPMGDFHAYETATGVEIPELTAANCGQKLLGVERSVFTRAGFLRFSDLPVSQDDALRRRLNSLVTTGDESGAADKLAQNLKDLKNRCRYNRSGLLPQAEEQRRTLHEQLDELSRLTRERETLRSRLGELGNRVEQLENHRMALRYAASLESAHKVAAAEAEKREAEDRLRQLQARCASLPAREEGLAALREGQELLREQQAIAAENAAAIPVPAEPNIPARYGSDDPIRVVAADRDAVRELRSRVRKTNFALPAAAAVLTVFGVALLAAQLLWGWASLAAGCLLGIAAAAQAAAIRKENAALRAKEQAVCAKYADLPADGWEADAARVRQQLARYREAYAAYEKAAREREERSSSFSARAAAYAGGGELSEAVEARREELSAWDALADAQRDAQRALAHYEALRGMAETQPPAPAPDLRSESREETETLLRDARLEMRQLHEALGQNQGRADALGDEDALRRELREVNARIARLEDTYAALEIAQNALSKTSAELQRRFAPRIAKRCQALFSRLTDGKYPRLLLRDDLSLQTAAADEDTLRPSLWRSDGTVDELYFALRMAVAEELTPDAPLILDDALVRFDDVRLRRALEVLKEVSASKQVIVFTCQGREAALMEEENAEL
ncbi:MAG: AAA family ATPase [Firmicutes bacterium]|nr:AAA family ATPase [Bacillota bacterium]